MKEEWRGIKGYNGIYQVSNLGRVRSWRLERSPNLLLDNPKIMRLATDKRGAKRVGLYGNGRGVTRSVHRLLAIAFIPNPENKPCINHIDGNPSNNNIDNLEWCTHAENSRHAWDNGLMDDRRGASNGRSKLSKEDVLSIRDEYEYGKTTYVSLAEKYGVGKSMIGYIINEENWTHI